MATNPHRDRKGSRSHEHRDRDPREITDRVYEEDNAEERERELFWNNNTPNAQQNPKNTFAPDDRGSRFLIREREYYTVHDDPETQRRRQQEEPGEVIHNVDNNRRRASRTEPENVEPHFNPNLRQDSSKNFNKNRREFTTDERNSKGEVEHHYSHYQNRSREGPLNRREPHHEQEIPPDFNEKGYFDPFKENHKRQGSLHVSC